MNIIAGGPGSGKTKKLIEITLDYLLDGKSVHIISTNNFSPVEENLRRLRLEAEKIGAATSFGWNHKLTVAQADTLGKLCKEIIDANCDVFLIDKTKNYNSILADMELVTMIASKLDREVYMTLNTKMELKDGVRIIDST